MANVTHAPDFERGTSPPTIAHHDLTIKTGTTVHYFTAGSPSNPPLVVLHGFPSSSTQYHDFAPLIAHRYHIIAPDLPGFGLTDVPSDFVYTFDNLTAVIHDFLVQLSIKRYAVYVFDYGAPIAWRLALQQPKAISAIVSQNGNAYDEGFGHPFWDPIMELWHTQNSAKSRELLRENILTPAVTKFQYTAGVPEADLALINPAQYTLDYLQNLSGPENQEHQLDLFYDYRKNADLYPKIQEYFRNSQVPLLAIWGKGDPAFVPAGAEAFKRDLPGAVVDFVDSGHFALETRKEEIARAVLEFLEKVAV